MERVGLLARRTQNSKSSETWSSIVFPVAFAGAILGVLLGTSGDCDNPVRLWLVVYMFTLAGYALFVTIVQLISRFLEDLDKLLKLGYIAITIQGIVLLFMFVWFIIGNVWLYSSDGCSSDWIGGYVLTLIILILWYIGFVLICCLCCCMCFGVGFAGALLGAAADEANQQPGHQANEQPLV
mmetsp:Transcript_34662/g.60948  ORF Transcript_34662/g.60948 Transcript_34662/m.60948 type:complete len:182 (+) Transcript_34662:110-655(+)